MSTNVMTATRSRAPHVQPSAWRFIATFGYAWGTIALIACTAAMLIGARFTAPITHAFGPDGHRTLVIGTLAVLVISSFVLGRRVVRSLYRGAPRTRNIALLALGLLALVCAFAWPHA